MLCRGLEKGTGRNLNIPKQTFISPKVCSGKKRARNYAIGRIYARGIKIKYRKSVGEAGNPYTTASKVWKTLGENSHTVRNAFSHRHVSKCHSLTVTV